MGPLKRRTFVIVAGICAAIAAVIWWQFHTDIAAARSRATQGSTMIETPCGLIEYQDVRSGEPLLAVHGSGGGYDQGMAFAAPLTSRGTRVIAMSRFGYLRTPMPEGASAETQAASKAISLQDCQDHAEITRVTMQPVPSQSSPSRQSAADRPQRTSRHESRSGKSSPRPG